MTDRAAHSSRWLTADVIYGISVVTALALNYFWPLSFGFADSSPLRHLIGAPLLLLGGAVIYLAQQALAAAHQPTAPGEATTTIVTGGPYRFSRNPLYTGLTLCYCGLGVAVDIPWLLILALPTAFVTQQLLIVPEERYLEEKFGAEYVRYRTRVRRWF